MTVTDKIFITVACACAMGYLSVLCAEQYFGPFASLYSDWPHWLENLKLWSSILFLLTAVTYAMWTVWK